MNISGQTLSFPNPMSPRNTTPDSVTTLSTKPQESRMVFLSVMSLRVSEVAYNIFIMKDVRTSVQVSLF